MENRSVIPTICIVGRPNVGKSSLLNCLLEERRAVVVKQSGTTRDRVEVLIRMRGFNVKLVDTGGYTSKDKSELFLQIKDQIYRAMEEASVIIIVVDTIAGIVPADKEIAALLRKFNKPVILVANKIDNDKLAADAVEFYQLGFGRPEEVSCLHDRGIRKLRKRMLESIGKVTDKTEKQEARQLKIAIVGRPNVGKSSFVNNLLACNRVIVSDIPGTTRDSIDTYFSYKGDEYILIDTAGIRHGRKVKTVVDSYSMMHAKESIKRADVVFLLLDAADGVTKDDMGILNFVEDNGKACLILVNKWDLAEKTVDISMDDYEKHLVYAASELSKFPLLFISAKTGKNMLASISMAKILDANLDLKVSTPFLNSIFKKKDPSMVSIPRRKKRPNFLYITQSSARPVGFKFFVNDPSNVLPAHLSFIENQLRANLPILGIPIKIYMRKSRKMKGEK